MIASIRQKVKQGLVLSGTFLNLGSPLTAEIAGKAGFDWVLIDCEHGAGDHSELVHQLQAIGCTQAAPIVRIAWNDPPRFKRVLDLGAAGVMVPYINTPDEALQAVAAMRYPPKGIRGVAMMNRACEFGKGFDAYFAQANDLLLTVVQIETAQAVDAADSIAAVDGVDVLFIGPTDLSASMGIIRDVENPRFVEAVHRVAAACRNRGKAAGILLAKPEQIAPHVEHGFTFIAIGSDGGVVQESMRRLAGSFQQFKPPQQ